MDLLDRTISLRLKVATDGKIQDYKVLTNTIISLNNKENNVRYFNKEIKKILIQAQFTKAKKASLITVPLIFK